MVRVCTRVFIYTHLSLASDKLRFRFVFFFLFPNTRQSVLKRSASLAAHASARSTGDDYIFPVLAFRILIVTEQTKFIDNERGDNVESNFSRVPFKKRYEHMRIVVA